MPKVVDNRGPVSWSGRSTEHPHTPAQSTSLTVHNLAKAASSERCLPGIETFLFDRRAKDVEMCLPRGVGQLPGAHSNGAPPVHQVYGRNPPAHLEPQSPTEDRALPTRNGLSLYEALSRGGYKAPLTLQMTLEPGGEPVDIVVSVASQQMTEKRKRKAEAIRRFRSRRNRRGAAVSGRGGSQDE
jgi:hypothetical protein